MSNDDSSPARQLSQKQDYSEPLGQRLTLFLLVLVVTTVSGTFLILSFGPAPEAIDPSSDLWPDFTGTVISEPSDRLLLVFWLTMGLTALAVSLWLAHVGEPLRFGRSHTFATWLLFAVLTFLLGFTLIPSTEPHDNWQGLSFLAVAFAALVTVLLAVVKSRLSHWWPIANVVAAVVALAYLVGAAWQTHWSIRDPFHFGISMDDYMRGSTLAIPYADYLPTYSAFLGHPLFLIRGLPGQVQADITTYWILALQVVSIIAAFLLVRSASARGNGGLAGLLLIAPVAFAAVGTGQSALQSAPVTPSRVLVPLIAFVLLLWSQRSIESRRWPQWSLVLAGFLLGVAALNNIEFGLTALVAALIAVAIGASNVKLSAVRVFWLLVGGSLFSALFLLTSSVASSPFDPLNVVRIQLIYAAAGYDLHPLISLGPYLPFVIVSLMSIALGTWQLRGSRSDGKSKTRGYVLLTVGLWMLFSFGYFAGRSFSSVLFAGLAIQLGILLAVLGESAWKKLPLRGPLTRDLGSTGAVALALLPTFFALMLIVGGNTPQRTLAFGLVGDPAVDFRNSDFDDVRLAIEMESLGESDGAVYLIVGPSAVTSRIAGMEDGAVMSRVFLSVSRTLMEFQCDRLPSDGVLVVDSKIADRMDSLSACRERLNRVGADVAVVPGLDVRIYQLLEEPYLDARRVTE